MNLGDSFPEKKGMFTFGTNLSISRVFYQLLTKLETDEERFDVLKKAIENSENSINIVVYEISLLMQRHGEYEKKAKPDSEQIVTKEQLQELKSILKDKIEKWIGEHTFSNLENPLSLLYMWKRLDENNIINYLQKVTSNDEGVIQFLEMFNSVSYSHSSGDYTEKENKEFNYNSIKNFIDPKTIVQKVRELQKNIANYDVTEESIFSIKMFLDYYDGKIKDDRF